MLKVFTFTHVLYHSSGNSVLSAFMLGKVASVYGKLILRVISLKRLQFSVGHNFLDIAVEL